MINPHPHHMWDKWFCITITRHTQCPNIICFFYNLTLTVYNVPIPTIEHHLLHKLFVFAIIIVPVCKYNKRHQSEWMLNRLVRIFINNVCVWLTKCPNTNYCICTLEYYIAILLDFLSGSEIYKSQWYAYGISIAILWQIE